MQRQKDDSDHALIAVALDIAFALCLGAFALSTAFALNRLQNAVALHERDLARLRRAHPRILDQDRPYPTTLAHTRAHTTMSD